MTIGTSTAKPLDNISVYIGNALPLLFREIGKSIYYAIRGSAIYTLTGALIGFLITQIPVIFYGSSGQDYFSQIGLPVAGAFSGMLIGFMRGLRHGVKRIITGQAATGVMFRDIISGVVHYLEGPDSAARMKLLLRDLARQTHYTDYEHHSALSIDDKLSANFMNAFSRRIGECLDAASDQVNHEDFRTSDKNQIIERFTAFCRDKSSLLLGNSIDKVFSKFMLITYITALVLFLASVITSGIFR